MSVFFRGLPGWLLMPVLLLVLSGAAAAQTPAQQARANALEAMQLIDKGELDAAIGLLQEARQLAPGEIAYPYELGYAYYQKKEMPKALAIYQELIRHPQADAQCYQMLGNAYDETGDTTAAISTYEAGIKRFPKAGRLYLERGNMDLQTERYYKALGWYERGIAAEPAFPSNYYRATLIYAHSSEKMWALLYGEAFMNLERNTARTAEISKLLYQVYREAITVKSATEGGVDLSRNVMVVKDAKKLKLPFAMPYTLTMTMGLPLEQLAAQPEYALAALHQLRQNFIGNWFLRKHDKEHPSALFSYQQALTKAGHAEAYTHWLLMMGRQEESAAWQRAHATEWQAFVQWYTANALQLDQQHPVVKL